MRKETTMDAKSMADVWASNKTKDDRWVSDYGKRTGKPREQIVSERNANRFHDERAEVVGTYDGYRLSACMMGEFGLVRYTVETPWDLVEGLCDLGERNDDVAVERLLEVISEIPEALENEHERPNIPPKAAKSPVKDVKASQKPRQAAGKATTTSKSTKTVEPDAKKPAQSRRRGRPVGSRDSAPRKRRTKAEMAAGVAKHAVKTPILNENGLRSSNQVAWIIGDDGRYHPFDVWYGESWLQVEIDGNFVDMPVDAILSPKNERPKLIDRLER